MHVDFYSLSFAAIITPQKVNFTYVDYMNPVMVTVSAANDFVQESYHHYDAILTNVASNDSFVECTAAKLSRICPQAVSYNLFTDTPVVNVTIFDDDYAGVAVSHTKVFATFDNYGNPRSSASYNLTLTSRPTRDVVVSVLPNSIYSTVEPTANVTFQPDDWNTPKTLYISASARTLDRPVCSSGRRYCNALKY